MGPKKLNDQKFLIKNIVLCSKNKNKFRFTFLVPFNLLFLYVHVRVYAFLRRPYTSIVGFYGTFYIYVFLW